MLGMGSAPSKGAGAGFQAQRFRATREFKHMGSGAKGGFRHRYSGAQGVSDKDSEVPDTGVQGVSCTEIQGHKRFPVVKLNHLYMNFMC